MPTQQRGNFVHLTCLRLAVLFALDEEVLEPAVEEKQPNQSYNADEKQKYVGRKEIRYHRYHRASYSKRKTKGDVNVSPAFLTALNSCVSLTVKALFNFDRIFHFGSF